MPTDRTPTEGNRQTCRRDGKERKESAGSLSTERSKPGPTSPTRKKPFAFCLSPATCYLSTEAFSL